MNTKNHRKYKKSPEKYKFSYKMRSKKIFNKIKNKYKYKNNKIRQKILILHEYLSLGQFEDKEKTGGAQCLVLNNINIFINS